MGNFHYSSKGRAPLARHLFLPWNGSLTTIPSRVAELTSSSSPGIRIHTGFDEEQPIETLEAPVMADLTLMPAPGERFWIDVQCLDQLLGEVQTAVFAKVSNTLKISIVYAL